MKSQTYLSEDSELVFWRKLSENAIIFTGDISYSIMFLC